MMALALDISAGSRALAAVMVGLMVFSSCASPGARAVRRSGDCIS